MKTLSLAFALLAISVFTLGCGEAETTKNDTTKTQNKDDGHIHGEKGPHGGHLIELGRAHEYHAELLEDHETESVTIYIMDGDMKPLSIKQASVSLVLSAGDKSKTFDVLAIQPGGASDFKSNDENLMEMLETDGVTGKLRVTINDKPHSGTIDLHSHVH